MSTYRFSADANQDIAQISDYIFERIPAAAQHFLDELDRTCELLATHPLIGRYMVDTGVLAL